MVNYFRNSAWKSGRKVQYHGDSNAFCAVGSFYCRTLYLNILPHLGRVAGVTLCPLTVVLVMWRYGAAESVEMQSCGGGSGLATAAAVRSRLFSKAKVKSLCMTAVIVAAFIICWTPYQVANTYRGTQLGSHVCACDCCPVSERQLSSPEFALRGAELLWRYLIIYRKMFVDASKCLTFQTRTMPLTNLNASSWKKNVPDECSVWNLLAIFAEKEPRELLWLFPFSSVEFGLLVSYLIVIFILSLSHFWWNKAACVVDALPSGRRSQRSTNRKSCVCRGRPTRWSTLTTEHYRKFCACRGRLTKWSTLTTEH